MRRGGHTAAGVPVRASNGAPAFPPRPVRCSTLHASMADALRILLLEDEPPDADLIERELRRSFEVVMHRVDSRDAFAAALRDFAPDLILSDHGLAQFDTLAAIQASRELRPAPPVIVVAGTRDEGAAAGWAAAGAADVGPKDDLSRLVPAIRAALEQPQTAALARSERRYRTLVDQNADPIVLSDRTGAILYASETIRQLLGYTAEEWVGRPGLEFVHPDDRALARRVLTGGLSWPGEPMRTELRCRHKNGTWRTLEVVTVNRLDDPAVGAVVSDCREIARYKPPDAVPAELGAAPPDILSPRQRQVLRLLAEGQSTRKIAEQLSVSVKTVETHRAQIMKRLNIRHLAGLVRYAVSLGLVQAP
jgi:PAS domain S-box-containing protein